MKPNDTAVVAGREACSKEKLSAATLNDQESWAAGSFRDGHHSAVVGDQSHVEPFPASSRLVPGEPLGMVDDLPLYEITPRLTGDGFDLTGLLIKGRLRYRYSTDAHEH